MARYSLADVKDAGNIGCKQLLPFVVGKVFKWRTKLHACVIDKNFGGADFAFNRVDTCLHRFNISDVKIGGMCLVACISQIFYRCVDFGLIATVDNYFGTMLGEALSQSQANALAGAGYQGQFARQVEERKCHWFLPDIQML
ncbi:hypothetical protein D9M68_900200 [compost metagenome]